MPDKCRTGPVDRGGAGWTLAVAVLALCAFPAVEADDCPIEIDPPAVVVKYGDPISVNCTVFTEHMGMGWVAKQNPVPNQQGVQSLLWTVENLTVWDINPQCFANFKRVPQCLKKVSVTVYKTPDSVSISSENHTSSLVERRQHRLVCEVQNVAPIQNLMVKWYKGIEVVNITLYSGESKTPVNVSSTFLITPNRTDDGTQYKCVAELHLGPEGPQPPPAVESEPFRVTVHYAPSLISSSSEVMEVRKGEKVTLNCTAQGNPPPVYSWNTSHLQKMDWNKSVFTFSFLAPATYTCTADNYLGFESKHFTIQEKPGSLNTTWIVIITVAVFLAVVLIVSCCIYKFKG
uniref:Intercellular adhesion molecule 1-like n=1 Tax=Scleropages formosus TaxID=113540 RepID=A0A8C9SRP2_SCLFO